MSEIDFDALARATAEKYVDSQDIQTLMQIVYEMQLDYYSELSDNELIEAAEWYDIDVTEFELKGE